MRLPPAISLNKQQRYVYKTGLPFYDAARLIGVAHLFFGTASAEVEDKGVYWEVRGVSVKRDDKQTLWIIEYGKTKSHDLQQKEKQIQEAYSKVINDPETKFYGLPTKSGYPALKEFDATLQYGPRGVDPLKDPILVSSQGTKPKRETKEYQISAHELVISAVGFSFSAAVECGKQRTKQRTYILPIFRERFVLSGYLTYRRSFRHSASGFVAEVLAAMSILVDLTQKKIPVVDFAYTRIIGRNVFSSSGYLGLEKLCSYWSREVVRKENRRALLFLHNLRRFLESTKSATSSDMDSQVQNLARWVAEFTANASVEALCKIEQLKARIWAAAQSRWINGAPAVQGLLSDVNLLKEVRNMMQMDELPEVPWQISEALARALSFDEKGWMNQFTRLENTGNFSQLIQQLEHIISRGFYREQLEQEGKADIRAAVTRARDLASKLREIECQLRDEKAFRAWRAIFLLDVLSRARFKTEGAPQTEGAEETQTPKEGS